MTSPAGGTARVNVAVAAPDPLDRAGIVSHLGSHPDLEMRPGDPDVLVRCGPTLATGEIATSCPAVLVVDRIGEDDLLTAVECRIVAVLPRFALTADRLVHSVLTAAAYGAAVAPPNRAGALLRHIRRVQRDRTTPVDAGLSPHEIEILRLMADGWCTEDIAARLRYSERTVKGMIYEIIHRLDLRSRCHAVAYAVRAGII
jgi:DNA-binding NarL/FixJ family response regulator